ncbi:hypothetical protein QTP70_035226, partial [Hemibagrus guttatus]
DTPWTECQPITGHTHTLSFTHYRQVRDANQPTMHVFGPGKKLEYPEETRGEHANSAHTWQRRESKPQFWRCEANVLATMPPWSKTQSSVNLFNKLTSDLQYGFVQCNPVSVP